MGFSAPRTRVKGEVPRGFVTDFASVPPRAQSIVQKDGRFTPAAVVHDYLYWEQPVDRLTADNVMFELMEARRVPPRDRDTIYNILRLLGRQAWEQNKKDRLAGKPRILPEKWMNFPLDGYDWEELERYLIENPNLAQRPGGSVEIGG
ncbi:DUF1353 domain-containing protein [Haloferula chungangensis]|uniref:DUF1353 domain-containing protein n=1 Tax=Haloferula chungangensis TaxID=1048331 RepID=A0ABW2LB60_9BACT